MGSREDTGLNAHPTHHGVINWCRSQPLMVKMMLRLSSQPLAHQLSLSSVHQKPSRVRCGEVVMMARLPEPVSGCVCLLVSAIPSRATIAVFSTRDIIRCGGGGGGADDRLVAVFVMSKMPPEGSGAIGERVPRPTPGPRQIRRGPQP